MLQRPLPPNVNFGFFKDHYYFVGFSSYNLFLSYLDSLMEFQLEAQLDFSLDMFKSAFIHLVRLLVGGPLTMVFEHLWDIFDLEDSTNNFS